MIKESGVITHVEITKFKGTGFLIYFTAKKGIFAPNQKEVMWISQKLAHDLGFIPEGPGIPMPYDHFFVGKKIMIIDEQKEFKDGAGI